MTDPRTTTAEPEPETTELPADDYMADGEFDLDRYQAETRRKPYRFRWAGQSWELPNVYDLPFSILDLVGGDDEAALPVEKVADGLKAAFGPEQWHQINLRQPLPIMATVELFNRWMVFCGVDQGEVSSSAGSSSGTAEPSKRTSAPTTASTSARRSTAGRKTAARRGGS